MSRAAVYKITCVANGRFYVGSSKDFEVRKRVHFSDLRLGRHRNSHMQRCWDKYGRDSFSFEVIERVEDQTKLIEREQHYLDTLRPELNSRKVADSNLGYEATEETRAKLRAAAARRRGQPGPMKGKTHTPQAREKMSKAKKGMAFFKGCRHSEETKQLLSVKQMGGASHRARPVEQLSLDGAIVARFDSLIEAEKSTKVAVGNIKNVLKGRAFTAGGFFWRAPGDEGALVRLREAALQDNRGTGRRGGMMLPRLRELRSRRGLTQRELGQMARVKHQTISDLETGRRWAQAETARKLAVALGVAPGDFTAIKLDGHNRSANV